VKSPQPLTDFDSRSRSAFEKSDLARSDSARIEVLSTPKQAPIPKSVDEDMVFIAGDRFLMGSDKHYSEEAPSHQETVGDFWMDKYEVTNGQFAKFVDATGYVTVAQRPPDPKDYPGAKPDLLQPASVVFRKPGGRVDLRNHFNWWTYIAGADWRHPEGPESSIAGREHHPVVHVAYEDAQAYAKWVSKKLPTEAEWEFAARGGIDGATYAWGEELNPNGEQMANTWQGEFPWENLLSDGYEGCAPVGQFPANGYGLFDMIGNVWELTSDWYTSRHAVTKPCCGGASIKESHRELSYDPLTPAIRIPRRVIKGGSFLCAPNYCRRYRPAARMAQAIDTPACHVGFRLIIRAKRDTDGQRCHDEIHDK
jgi:formylglycine-generating enzyme